MNIELEKIAKTLKEYEEKNGTIAVRSHENVNTCKSCWSNAVNCTATCQGTCSYTCQSGCSTTCWSR